jgi:hypothetical protein
MRFPATKAWEAIVAEEILRVHEAAFQEECRMRCAQSVESGEHRVCGVPLIGINAPADRKGIAQLRPPIIRSAARGS